VAARIPKKIILFALTVDDIYIEYRTSSVGGMITAAGRELQQGWAGQSALSAVRITGFYQ